MPARETSPDVDARARRRWLGQALVGLLALPLSVAPLWLYSTRSDTGRLIFLKARYSLLPPSTPGLDAAGERAVARDRRVAYRGVPVLVYHGIGSAPVDTEDRRFVVARVRFAEQMMSLREAGYHAITTGQLSRYLSTRDPRTLPSRPILITFDDGRVDAMLQGDRILRDSGMRATMFAIGRASESGSPYYESWQGLRDYATESRWELGNHTYDLHHQLGQGLAARSALVTAGRREPLRAYTARVAGDLTRSDRLLAGHPGAARGAFAYPFGDWGDQARPQVRAALRRLLAARFAVAFDQDEQEEWRPALPGDDPLHVHRLSVENWTGPQFLARLERGYRLEARRRRAAGGLRS